MSSYLHQCVKLNNHVVIIKALQILLSRLLHRYGYALVRIQQTRKPEPKSSDFKNVAVYDNDWDD